MTAQPRNTDTTIVRTEGQTFLLERIFDAPPELVFRAFSSCEHLARWWGPIGWSLPRCEIDFRPGGSWFYCMRGQMEEAGPEVDACGKAVYHEIVEPERIVYTDYFVDGDGNPLEGMPETRVTLEFQALDGRTRLIDRSEYASPQELEQVLAMGMEEGFKQTLDRLEAYLAGG